MPAPDPETPSRSPRWVLETDGASSGNPGPAGFGVVVRDGRTGRIVAAFARHLGTATNNEAEYHGLIAAAEYAVTHNLWPVEFRTDSQLLVHQIQGEFRVRSPVLRNLHRRLMNLLQQIPSWSLRRIPREANREADRLAKKAAQSAAGG